MKALYDFFPSGPIDTSVTITFTTESTSFPSANLKDLQPTKCYKTTAVNAEQTLKYDFGSNKTYDSCVINRFNFAEFYLEYSVNNTDWIEVAHKTGMTIDEINLKLTHT